MLHRSLALCRRQFGVRNSRAWQVQLTRAVSTEFLNSATTNSDMSLLESLQAQFNNNANRPHNIGPSELISQNVRALKQSATTETNNIEKELRSQGHRIYKFGFGQSPFPVPEMMVNELRKYAYRKDYLPVRGLPELREAIAQRQREDHGLNVTAEDVIVSPGSKEAVFLLQLAYYGELLLPAPSWVSYQPQADIIGRRVKWVNTSPNTNWKVTPDALLEELEWDSNRPRILVLNYPGNPTGVRYSMQELVRIANICREHRIVVLSDEIYAPLDHNKSSPHSSIASFYPEGTIVMTGISKWAGAGGWRLGAFVFPPNMRWMLDAVAVVASETYTCTSAPIQHASVPVFEQFHSDEMQAYLNVNRKVLATLASFGHKQLSDCGATVVKPDGGFYLFPDFTNVPNIDKMIANWSQTKHKPAKKFDSHEFRNYLFEMTGVSGMSGAHFGRPTNELTMRLAFVDFDGTSVLKCRDYLLNDLHTCDTDSSEMLQFCDEYCPNVMQGFRAISDYFNSL